MSKIYLNITEFQEALRNFAAGPRRARPARTSFVRRVTTKCHPALFGGNPRKLHGNCPNIGAGTDRSSSVGRAPGENMRCGSFAAPCPCRLVRGADRLRQPCRQGAGLCPGAGPHVALLGAELVGTEAGIRRGLPGDDAQARRSRRAVPLRQPGHPDRRSGRSDLGAGAHAADQPEPAAGAPRARRALLSPGFVRGRAQLPRIGAAVADRARGRAAPGRGVSRRGRQQAQPLQPGRRCLLRLALPVQRQPRPCGLARAAVRPAGQPQPGRPRHRPTGAR